MQKKQYESPPCTSSKESVDSETLQDPLALAIGRSEARGRLRGIGYGVRCKDYLPESPEPANMMRCRKESTNHPKSPEPAKMMRCRKESTTRALDEKVEHVVVRILAKGGQVLPPSNPCTPSPSEAVRRSSSASVEGYTHGSPSPIDDIKVIVVASKHHWKQC